MVKSRLMASCSAVPNSMEGMRLSWAYVSDLQAGKVPTCMQSCNLQFRMLGGGSSMWQHSSRQGVLGLHSVEGLNQLLLPAEVQELHRASAHLSFMAAKRHP
jgi:hypothetical protein